MAATQDITEKPVSISPRNLFMIIVGTATTAVLSLVWVASTFVTQTEFVELKTDFQSHVESGLILQLQRDERDYSDKLWDIQRIIKQTGGDTHENRTRERELKRGESEKAEQIRCIKKGEKHCIKWET